MRPGKGRPERYCCKKISEKLYDPILPRPVPKLEIKFEPLRTGSVLSFLLLGKVA